MQILRRIEFFVVVLGLITIHVDLTVGQIVEISKGPIPGWPEDVREVQYRSAADNSMQPALYYDPGGEDEKPLLVALHSWSGNYKQTNPAYGLWCKAKRWVMIHPDFRGVNQRPEACGSELVVQDILSAVANARSSSKIDPNRIYLIGASGGGYGSLLMAGRAPELWAGVSAWCPIFDLRAWHRETKDRKLRYANMLESVCGGAPGDSPDIDEQYRIRSAATWLAAASNVNLSINTGITDGHNGSVPVGHTLRAFNQVVGKEQGIAEKLISAMEAQPEMPPDLLQKIDDPLFGNKPALFRKREKQTQVTIFQGGHEIIYQAGLGWLERQRKGKPPVWDIQEVPSVDLTKLDSASGK